jgi:ribulose-5-phosphate 4-epimerase/fuculose-1-phosphate aldolase
VSLNDLLDDLVAANHILYRQGVVDGYGHVSVRNPSLPDTFFMAAAISPGRVQRSDLIELDLDGEPVDGGKRQSYSERFIHGEIYRVRSDVNAVVHSHSPGVIPFGLTDVPMRPVIHTASFMHAGVPVFDTKNVPEATTPLVNNPAVGRALAAELRDRDIILMRGHGDTVVGPELRVTVARAIYAEVNARLLMQTLALGRPIAYMQEDESRTMQLTLNAGRGTSHGTDRVWQLWLDEVRVARETQSNT